MGRVKVIWFIVCFTIVSVDIYAQDENIENHEIKVVKDYNVYIEEDVEKIKTPIEYYPKFKAESEINTLRYSIPQNIEKLKFVPKSISPIDFRVKKDTFNNYNFVKAGLGSLLNPSFEWSHVTGKKNIARLYAFNQSNFQEDRKFQKSSRSLVQYSQNFVSDKVLVKPTLTYNHIYSNFFGNLSESLYQFESGRQNHLGAFNLDIKKMTKTKLDVSNSFYAHYNQDNLDAYDSVSIHREIAIMNSNDLSFNINENFKFGNITNFEYNNLVIDSSRLTWSASLKPYVNYKSSAMTLVGGLEIPYVTQNDKSEVLFLPHLETYLRVVPNVLYFYSGWKRTIYINKMFDMVNQNHFISINPSNLPITKRELRKAGVHLKVKNSNWNLFFAQTIEDDRVLWKNDEVNPRYLSNVVESNFRTNSINVENSTRINNQFSATIKGSLFQYENDQLPLAYNLPQYELNLLANYDLNERLSFSLNSQLIGGVKTIIDSNEQTTDMALNLGLSSEYNVYKNLFIFARVNNILDASAERVYGYPILSRNYMLGFRIKY